jgi:exonuclease III
MKITSWNIRGMNGSSKQRLIKSKLSRMKADIILLQETKCDEGNIRRITQRIWLGCEARWIAAEGAFGWHHHSLGPRSLRNAGCHVQP